MGRQNACQRTCCALSLLSLRSHILVCQAGDFASGCDICQPGRDDRRPSGASTLGASLSNSSFASGLGRSSAAGAELPRLTRHISKNTLVYWSCSCGCHTWLLYAPVILGMRQDPCTLKTYWFRLTKPQRCDAGHLVGKRLESFSRLPDKAHVIGYPPIALRPQSHQQARGLATGYQFFRRWDSGYLFEMFASAASAAAIFFALTEQHITQLCSKRAQLAYPQERIHAW